MQAKKKAFLIAVGLMAALAIHDAAAQKKNPGLPPTSTNQDPPPQVSALDPGYYASQYADLARMASDKAALQKHWDETGRGQGRAPSAVGDPRKITYDNWRIGCLQDKWGPFHYRRGKASTVLKAPLCEEINYQFARAYHVMLAPPRSGNGGDYLRAGDYLKQGEYLTSNNKRFFASLQPDGNFCTYAGATPAARQGGAKWCSMTKSAGAGPFFAVQQNDGNFCVYRGEKPGDNRGGVYCVFTVSQGTTVPYYYAVLQDDANFAIERGSDPTNKWGHVWDRVTATPPKPDTGLESFWKDVQAAQAAMVEFQRQMDAQRAALSTPGLGK